GAPLHPRSVIVSALMSPAIGESVRVGIDGVAPWRPPSLPRSSREVADTARAVCERLSALGTPQGLARLLAGSESDDDVTARARPHARALARACATDDAV